MQTRFITLAVCYLKKKAHFFSDLGAVVKAHVLVPDHLLTNEDVLDLVVQYVLVLEVQYVPDQEVQFVPVLGVQFIQEVLHQ
ncbi:Hypothetical protein SRAE_2000442600 [Strongyloides ratti]|uniref:Uncharacterized protein n=1 Tax=Strongyloides ratti TaxID=34506 RepID=A0A090MZZ2_STRRB|nr:Hypothetical protein SRAE_2000442600 [Strongyloides ratti]CEF69780.1 Hypothetical protein SRAE_2000442600 [Strongyloides ratti]